MSTHEELQQLIAKAIGEVIGKEILPIYIHQTTESESPMDTDLTTEKMQESYTDFQYKFTTDIWQSLLERHGYTRMLATGREESILAIESQLELARAFRPSWLVSSKNCPQDHGLVFFKCNCLCHGEGNMQSPGRFHTQGGEFCCCCSTYTDL